VTCEPGRHGVTGNVVRVVDHVVLPGVEADMDDGDARENAAVLARALEATPYPSS
jgi:hypothetical protein